MSELLKSFFRGMGQAIDLGGTMAPRPQAKLRTVQTDTEALRGDWQRVGNDMRVALQQIEPQKKVTAE